MADGNVAVRGNVLQACATAPVPTASIPLPIELKQCERSILKFCGTWTLNGGEYAAAWSNNAKATLTVTRFDGQSIALHRVDTPDSLTAGMTADYLGDIVGNKMKGKVTYTWPGHNPPVGYGTWDATFVAAPTPPASPPISSSGTASSLPVSTAAAGVAAQPATTVAATPTANPAAAVSGACSLPTAPVNWFSDTYQRSAGQMWKINGGVLSYTDMVEHKPVSYRVTRPAFWKRWKSCAPDYMVTGMRDAGFWIWISDDRREAKVFDVMSSSAKDNYMLAVVMPPVNLVLEEEAQTH